MRFFAFAPGVIYGLLLLSVQPMTAAPEKWAAAIDRYTAADAVEAPPRGAVLFIGSSSIARWTTLTEDFPDVKTINRGFGGAEFADCVHYLDRIVLPYRPRIIVLYAGENDLYYGKSPDDILADFRAFCAQVHAVLPDTRVIGVGLKPSPALWRLREQIERTNALIAAECAKDERLTFVDVYGPMLDRNGEPRPELYAEDRLHMSAAGYAIWKSLIAPLLKTVEGNRG